MNPLRLSVSTYNLWNTQRWPEREPALRRFLERFGPDILGVQELRAETRACIDDVLGGHARVADEFDGWRDEGNLWWRRSLLEYVEHGAADFASHEPKRRLFWVRLRRRDGAGSVVVATAHLTHAGQAEEAATGQSPRVTQTRAIIEALTRIVDTGEPAWVMGDFNDNYHPGALLHRAGYTSCFADLHLQPPPTFPAIPTAAPKAGAYQSNACYDWITANANARALTAQVPHCFCNDLAPSDHWPVVAMYALDAAD